MARFYDTLDDADFKRVEYLLQKGGVVYSVQLSKDDAKLMKEILVAEEDIAVAEKILCGSSTSDH